MKRALLISLLVAMPVVLIPLGAHAAMFGPDEKPCADQQTTVDIGTCLAARTKVWDRRLNAAYQALGKVIDPEQREPLKAAQRLWIQYRDANCRFYGSHEGTIRQILAADCLRSMTEDRAQELEQAAKPQPATLTVDYR